MAALSLHSDPFAEVGASTVKPFSQRVVRHALAIMHLLITEGDLAGDMTLRLSLDQRTEDQKIVIDQIMKLVLGILHLLNEGPGSHEQAVNLSDEDWTHLEREQRELYDDLLTENEQTLQGTGSFNVKMETALGMGQKETPPTSVSASGQDGKSDACSDAPADPPRSPLPDSYHPNTFLSPGSDCSRSFHETSGRTSAHGVPSSACLGAFQRTCPDPCKDPYGTIFPDASGVNSYSEAYASSSTDDFTENISIIQIKREASPSDLQPQASTKDIDVSPETSCVEPALQGLSRNHGKPAKASNGSRAPKVSKPLDVTRAYVPSQDTEYSEETLKTQRSIAITKSYWGRYDTNASAKKPFQCLRCEKSFNCRSHLIMHHRVHTRERPYVCECGKAFTQSSNLFRHQRGHRHHRMQLHGQNYSCPQCNKEFPDLSILLTHQRTHHSAEDGLVGAVETCDSKIG
ncbi:zinc finger protein 7-like isoform X3 [Bufo bufo]|uniref:zinc finger protein 7-like isoform X3 n=1 Tax=Bufo bufo TaxID=8384 RepID=UPI001ABE99CE|nr:zinc finger protein 7-like isoform X3 [Bufo bufo]